MSTLVEQIAEMERILAACREHYPQQVAKGTLAQEVASHRLACLEATLRMLAPENATFAGEPPKPQPKPFPSNPLAKSISELATPKQIVMIRAICRDLDIDVDMELQETVKLDCKVEELSRRAASCFIDHLKELQEGNEIPIVRRAW